MRCLKSQHLWLVETGTAQSINWPMPNTDSFFQCGECSAWWGEAIGLDVSQINLEAYLIYNSSAGILTLEIINRVQNLTIYPVSPIPQSESITLFEFMNGLQPHQIHPHTTEIYDYRIDSIIGRDHSANLVYLATDKFRQPKAIRIQTLQNPHQIRLHVSDLLVFSQSGLCRHIQSINDFTVLRGGTKIMVAMPAPKRTLYSLIKDPTASLTLRLALSLNILQGLIYLHLKKMISIGTIRPESILLHEEANKEPEENIDESQQQILLYAAIASYCLLTERSAGVNNWEDKDYLQYYYSPEIGSRASEERLKLNEKKEKSDIWSLGLVLIQLFSGERIWEIPQLSGSNPAQMLTRLHSSESNRQNLEESNSISQLYQRLLCHIRDKELKSIIRKMIDLDPCKRPSAAQVYMALSELEVTDKADASIFYSSSLRREKPIKINSRIEITHKPLSSVIQASCIEEDEDSASNQRMGNIGNSTLLNEGMQGVHQPKQSGVCDFSINVPELLYSKKEITRIGSRHHKHLLKCYDEDCTDRLINDPNFTPLMVSNKLTSQDFLLEEKLNPFSQDSGDIDTLNLKQSMSGVDDKFKESDEWVNMSQPQEGENMKDLFSDKHIDIRYLKNRKERGDGKNWLRQILDSLKIHKHKQQTHHRQSEELNAQDLKFSTTSFLHSSLSDTYNSSLTNYQFLARKWHHRQKYLSAAVFSEGFSLQNSKRLNLKYRNLSVLPAYLMSICNLQQLSLANNRLTSLKPLVLYCKRLVVVDVQRNNLTGIDQELWKLDRLEQIFLGHNQITLIKGLSNRKGSEMCQRLWRLYLNDNRINEVENMEDILRQPALRVVCLKNNPIQEAESKLLVSELNKQNIRVII